MIRSPWHAKHQAIFHNNTDCLSSREIELKERRPGQGGRRMCKECLELTLRRHDLMANEESLTPETVHLSPFGTR